MASKVRNASSLTPYRIIPSARHHSMSPAESDSVVSEAVKMSTKAAAFSIAALLGLQPTSRQKNESENIACRTFENNDDDADEDSMVIDVEGEDEDDVKNTVSEGLRESPCASAKCSIVDCQITPCQHLDINKEFHASDQVDKTSVTSLDSIRCSLAGYDDKQTEGKGASSNSVRCRLETQNLWNQFRRLGLTEMIITKAGRRMFPSVRVNFCGLDADAVYDILLDILPVDDRRYRYAYHRSCWVVASDSCRVESAQSEIGLPEPPSHSSMATFRHPDSPFSGRQLEQRTVSFDRVKLTNSTERGCQRNGYVVLSSMRKYRPRIRLIRRSPGGVISYQQPIGKVGNTNAVGKVVDLTSHQAGVDADENTHSFLFQECVFIAVTAYQNQLITKLKIENNPFAKGFREFSRFGRQPDEVHSNSRKDRATSRSSVSPDGKVGKVSSVGDINDFIKATSGGVVMTPSSCISYHRPTATAEQWCSNPALIPLNWTGVPSHN